MESCPSPGSIHPSVTGTRTELVDTLDGARLAVHLGGRGRPVLFLSGLGHASWSWDQQTEFFQSHYRTVCLDNRGTGESVGLGREVTVPRMARDAADVLDRFADHVSVHVVGASMGGYVAATLAAERPELVASLTLIASSIGGPDALGVPAETTKLWATAATLSAEEFAVTTMPIAFRPGWTRGNPREFKRLLAARRARPTTAPVWRAQFEACEAYLADGVDPKDLGGVPTLVIHGTADSVVPYANAELTATKLPSARLRTLPGAGHLCWIEERVTVNQCMLDFFRDVERERNP